MKKLLVVLAVFALTGCSWIQENRDNGNINIGDGKLWGSEAAYNVMITAAQIAKFERPALYEGLVKDLNRVRADVVDFEQSFTWEQALELVDQYIDNECGVYCSTALARPYVDRFRDKLRDLEAFAPDDATVTLVEIIDLVLAYIERV